MTEPPKTFLQKQGAMLKRRIKRALVWIRANVPPGLRLLLGLILMAGGLFAFLPVLGLWMLPLGFAVAALDIKPLWRWLQGRRDRQ